MKVFTFTKGDTQAIVVGFNSVEEAKMHFFNRAEDWEIEEITSPTIIFREIDD